MTDDPFDLTPDLSELLANLAGHPKARSFRVPVEKIVSAALSQTALGLPIGVRMEAAERELVRVRRGEVALLLRQLFVHEIDGDPEARNLQYRIQDPIERAALEKLVGELSLDAPRDSELVAPVELLRTCAGSRPGSISLQRIATSALLLQDSPTSRIYLAEALLADGQARTASELLQRLLSCPLPPLLRRSALEFAAIAAYDLGDKHTALERSMAAARVALENDEAGAHVERILLNALLQALHRGNPGATLWAARGLEERAQADSPMLLTRIERYRASAARPTPGSGALDPSFLRGLARTAGPVTTRILEGIS